MSERAEKRALFDPSIVRRAVKDSFLKLDPRQVARNPVMFVVEVGSVLTTALIIRDIDQGNTSNLLFTVQVSLWLWFTVLFANFAEAMAEGRGKAQADTLRKAKTETIAHRITHDAGDSSGAQAASSRRLDEDAIQTARSPGPDAASANSQLALQRFTTEAIAAPNLRRDDLVLVRAGEFIPGDGEIVEGVASVDESAITGESAPVIRESGGDRSAVTGGTKVISDWIKVRITSNPGETFIDRMIALVEGAERQKTPNEIALNILLAGLTIIFLLAVVTLLPYAIYSVSAADPSSGFAPASPPSITVLVALLVCLIPTTIGGLLSAIGIAGMDRLIQHNVLAMSGRAVEAAGDVNTLLLDKTGTITLGNRQAVEFFPMNGVSETDLADAAQLSSLSDETPEGRSIVVLAKSKYNLRGRDLSERETHFVAFTAQTRMSGVDIDGRAIRKGAVDSIAAFIGSEGGIVPLEMKTIVERIASSGGTPLAVADHKRALGVIHLKDIVKGGMKERFDQLRRMGIKTVMITGDNPLTAAAIASEAGVDDFLAEAQPEDKMALIKREQSEGKLVAMTGDGTNDAPALAQADVGVAMNTGTMAAKEAGNMVDLDSNPTKLIEIVEIGKQLLMTRGALTTFSIANDVAKYFAIIPAMFSTLYMAAGAKIGPLAALNIMRLATPESAILSAVIFNALIIVALIPLALRGIRYRPIGAASVLRQNLLIYGLGGIVIPFVGIKIIDLIITAIGLA